MWQHLHWRLFARERHFVICASATLFLLAVATFASQRVHLVPKFTPGMSLRYQVEMQTTINGKITAPIVNPEGESRFEQAVTLVIRLDVLDAGAAPSGDVRIRATYEQSHAKSESDANVAQSGSPDDRYDRLQGRAIEFTIQSNGELANFKGLEDIFPNRSEADPILSWAASVSTGTGMSRDGIRLGQKWTKERPLEGAPLKGLMWRTESTYLRDEQCDAPGPARDAVASPSEIGDNRGDRCAVILTSFEILRHGSARGDATPEDYVHNGLRTSGQWTGSGESLDSISLATRLLVSSTQTSTQDMDYKIVSAITGSSIHRTGRVQSQTEITLLP